MTGRRTMAVMEIRKNGDPALRKQSKRVRAMNDDLAALGRDMVETMLDAGGVGLAANQVGRLKRIIAVLIDDEPRVLVNPKIVKKSADTEINDEGCLSIPGVSASVNRHVTVRVKAFDVDMKPVSIDAEGLLARAFQHELDHLNGITILDRAEPGTVREITLETESAEGGAEPDASVRGVR
ncbi:MAG: peptide deformylase [bacterium]